MENTPRIIGDNPPQRYWAKYPNWENAWDEERDEGQDETTLRPSENQSSIDEDVTFAAGNATLADGTTLPALLALVEGDIDCVYVYPATDGDRCWSISSDEPGRWDANDSDEELGLLPVPKDITKNLPITIRSRLPLKRSGTPIEEVISTIFQ